MKFPTRLDDWQSIEDSKDIRNGRRALGGKERAVEMRGRGRRLAQRSDDCIFGVPDRGGRDL